MKYKEISTQADGGHHDPTTTPYGRIFMIGERRNVTKNRGLP